MRKPKSWLAALFLGAASHALFGQALHQLPTVYLEQGDFFGISADINGAGTYVVVGAPFHTNYADATDQQEGVAFVYTLSGGGWTIQDTLDLPTLTDMDGFGTAVSINTAGNLIAVGIPGPENGRGDARLFKRSGFGWGMLPPLQHMGNAGEHTSASPGDHFGAVLTLDGSGYYMAVGSPASSNAKGRANVCWFNADPLVNDWEYYASFDNPDPDKSDFFGAALAIDEGALHLIIGAPGEDSGIGGNNNEIDYYGAAYYYQRDPMTQNTWNFVQKIKPSSLLPMSQFGMSADINSAGDSLIIGAPGHGGSGAAFLYKRVGNAWVETDVIQSYNPDADETFGASVAMSGNGGMALVGAPLRDTASILDIGSVFAFQYASPSAGWTQFKHFSLPPGYEATETFGACVSMARNNFSAVIGSPFRDDFRGAAFVLLPSALPVTWLSFRAALEGDDVQLTWSTASESNNEGFGVQRSENGRDWQTLAFVPGAGTTSEVTNYEYTDQSPITNHQSLYYRLQQRDFDGTTDYSPIRVIQLGTQSGLRVYPNPANEVATISFAQPTEARGWLRLLNGNGRLLAEHSIPVGTTDYQLRVAQLPAGTYLLEVKVGVKEWMRRLVVE
jgi:hypothetical protein